MVSKRVFIMAGLAFALLTTAAFAASVVNFDVITAFNNTGKLDITNNEGVLRNATLSVVQSQIVTGYDGGDWLPATQPSITSTNAAVRAGTDGLTGIGYASNDLLGYTSDWNGAAFPNGPLSGTSNEILLQYTWLGDTDLSGKVDRSDYTTALTSYKHPSTTYGWIDGDTDYDGQVLRSDMTTIIQAYKASNPGSGSPPASSGGISPVPEPATWILLVVALTGLIGIKSRRK